MSMLKCPICHKPGITKLRKAFLGPALPTRCKNCGKKIGVSFGSLKYMIPFLLTIPLSLVLDLFQILFIFMVVAIIITYRYVKYEPLVSKE